MLKKLLVTTLLIQLVTPPQLTYAAGLADLGGPDLGTRGAPDTRTGGAEFRAGGYPGAVMMPVQVWGGAVKPGNYEVPVKTDLASFLTYTGGPLTTAKLDEVVIRRTSKGKPQLIKVDVQKLFEEPQRLSPPLEPNDVVLIPVKKPFIDPDVAQTISVAGIVISTLLSVALATAALRK